MTRLGSSLLIATTIVLGWLGLSARASAAPDANAVSEHRGYIYAAPAFFAVPLADDDVTDVVDLSYQWGVGAGGLWGLGPKKRFGLSVGFAFEHSPATLDDDFDDFCDAFDVRCSFHVFRFLPEVRLGGMFNRVFAYGMLAPGLGLTYVKFDNVAGDDDDSDVGFNLGLGGGAQVVVWRSLFVGGELGFDLGFYSSDEDDIGDDDYQVHTLDLKALIGWYF